MEQKSIMIVGVGGQGTLLASRIIGRAMVSRGCDVRVSEVHGMSQRGGSVVTYVKYGAKIFSPVICRGEADVILSFEQLEAARWLPYLKKGGLLITGTQRINPMPVITGAAAYPEDIIGKIKAKGVDVKAVDAVAAAREAGSEKAVNTVLLGVLSSFLGEEGGALLEALGETVPPKTLEINIKAFKAGQALAASV